MNENLFEQVEDRDVDPIAITARELVREQQRREIRFRLNLILLLVIAILAIDSWRVYRNEMIWSHCVAFNMDLPAGLATEQKEIAP